MVYVGCSVFALLEKPRVRSFYGARSPFLGPYPAPSVLVIDNASIHRSEQIEKMCRDACVKLVYLPIYFSSLDPVRDLCRVELCYEAGDKLAGLIPYSLYVEPTEESVVESKGFVNKNRHFRKVFRAGLDITPKMSF